MEEKILFCRDCHNLFVFSIKEQQYFEKKGSKLNVGVTVRKG